MTIQEASMKISRDLQTIYDEGESNAISDLVIEYITGSRKTDRIFQREKMLTPDQEKQLQAYTARLLQHEPVQYVLNESWFCGLKLYVDKNVLIPRPETEEMVEWVISNCKFPVNALSILDIGSGSGCISLALKRKLRRSQIWSCDASPAALEVAKRNATNLNIDVNFLLIDFLDEIKTKSLPSFDIIISNPPYIPEKDKQDMQPNVLNYEPHTALFVPDNDALIFYKAIALFGKEHLNAGGNIYVEMHGELARAVEELFIAQGYSTVIKKDMQGKERMLKARI